MASRLKGIYRGFKFISRLFVRKEREMEIGYPTDVKHLAHIGTDGPDGPTPSWMNEIKTSSSFSMSSVGSISGSYTDPATASATASFERSFRWQQTSDSNLPKKQKHKKGRSPSSSKKSSSSH